jgi:hypothetical protein
VHGCALKLIYPLSSFGHFLPQTIHIFPSRRLNTPLKSPGCLHWQFGSSSVVTHFSKPPRPESVWVHVRFAANTVAVSPAVTRETQKQPRRTFAGATKAVPPLTLGTLPCSINAQTDPRASGAPHVAGESGIPGTCASSFGGLVIASRSPALNIWLLQLLANTLRTLRVQLICWSVLCQL